MSISGVSYQQANQVYQNSQQVKTENRKETGKTASKSDTVKVSEWKPVSEGSSLTPTTKAGYGTVVGNVELSDKAKAYYDKLKNKFHGMDFILVSKDMKSQVEANASAYGNASKPVVLIDEEKLERMATDENFRKKYEGLIAMSQSKLMRAKNSLTSSGAKVRNFGMRIGEDGRASFFATVEKANTAQTKALQKRQEAKKAEKAKAKKKAEKEAREDRIEKRRDEKTEKTKESGQAEQQQPDYLEFEADTIEDLVDAVSRYAYDSTERNVLAKAESEVGQRFDFRG